MALMVENGMQLKDIDISAAFLHEPFQGERPFYVERTPSFNGQENDPSDVYRVARNIYGTRNDPRVYSDGLTRQMKTIRCEVCSADDKIYYKRTSTSLIVVAVAVEDFCEATTTEAAYQQFLGELRVKFSAKDLGNAT